MAEPLPVSQYDTTLPIVKIVTGDDVSPSPIEIKMLARIRQARELGRDFVAYADGTWAMIGQHERGR